MPLSYAACQLFLSTLSLRRATHGSADRRAGGPISIHALLAESDGLSPGAGLRWWKFLSTLSLRRATDQRGKLARLGRISIHALLAESDMARCGFTTPPTRFLSTLSLRRATAKRRRDVHRGRISIHALLAESDRLESINLLPDRYFYPRSPCGERPVDTAFMVSNDGNFYPRSPCGERRDGRGPDESDAVISIHALLAESDVHGLPHADDGGISIHALLAESDFPIFFSFFKNKLISIHALLAESDCLVLERLLFYPNFYPRSPCGERHCTA